MSIEVSHKAWWIESWPPRAITPQMLYLRFPDEVPAIAYANAGRWECLVFAADDAPVIVPDVSAARDWLTAWVEVQAA